MSSLRSYQAPVTPGNYRPLGSDSGRFVVPMKQDGLADRLLDLPTLHDFKDQFTSGYFKDTYTRVFEGYRNNHGITQDDGVIGMKKDTANILGISERHARRYDGIDNPLYDGILDYRNNVATAIRSDPVMSGIDRIVSNSDDPRVEESKNRLLDESVNQSLYDNSLTTQFYASLDYSMAQHKPLKEAREDATKAYLTFVANHTGFEEEYIKHVIGTDESSTTVATTFKRHGLDFKSMKEEFEKQVEHMQREEEKQRWAA